MSSPRYLSLGLNVVVAVLIEPDHGHVQGSTLGVDKDKAARRKASRPFGYDQTAGFDALVVVFCLFFVLAGSWCTPRWRPFWGDWFLVERGGPLGPFGPRGGGACTWWFCFECFGPACGVLFCVCFAPNDEEPIVLKPRRRQPH